MKKIMQKKRERTRLAILKSTEVLISQLGFETTSMELIAEKAQIATGTLYNYFPSKSLLLITIYDNLTKQLLKHQLERTVGVIDTVTAIKDINELMLYMSKTILLFPKAIMRQLIAQMYLFDPTELSELVSMDMAIMSALFPLLTEMQQANLLADNIDVEQAAMLIYGMVSIQQHVMLPLHK